MKKTNLRQLELENKMLEIKLILAEAKRIKDAGYGNIKFCCENKANKANKTNKESIK